METDLRQLPVLVPAFFVEACGYRGRSRYVAMRWDEAADELWLSDCGHAVRGNAGTMAFLWRRPGGQAALDRLRAESGALGRPAWIIVDRELHVVMLGHAADAWSVISRQLAAEDHS